MLAVLISDRIKPKQPPFGCVTNRSMSSGDSYQDGEENGSADPSRTERGLPVEQVDRAAERTGSGGGSCSGMASGSGDDEEVDEWHERRRVAEESVGEPSGADEGHTSIQGTRRHRSLADGSIGSTTGSGSSKR